MSGEGNEEINLQDVVYGNRYVNTTPFTQPLPPVAWRGDASIPPDSNSTRTAPLAGAFEPPTDEDEPALTVETQQEHQTGPSGQEDVGGSRRLSTLFVPAQDGDDQPTILLQSESTQGSARDSGYNPGDSTPVGSGRKPAPRTEPSVVGDGGVSYVHEKKRRVSVTSSAGQPSSPSTAPDLFLNKTWSQFWLGQQLRAAVVSHPTGDKQFIPVDVFDRLITEEAVVLQLTSGALGKTMTKDQLGGIAKAVCDTHKYTDSISKSTKLTTRQRLFSALALVERDHEITQFIDHRLYDCDLPFERTSAHTLDVMHRHGERTGHKVICCDHWTGFTVDGFELYQWQMLSPIFINRASPDSEQEKVLHYPLEPKIVLPFVLDEEQRSPYGIPAANSSMWKIKIHPAHHDFLGLTKPRTLAVTSEANSLVSQCATDLVFARKQLFTDDEKEFDQEVEALKKVIHKGHTHLIKLLATYKYQKTYSLIFPWADGNLRDFWKTNPEGPQIPGSCTADTWARWLAHQCHGIVAGLNFLHNVELHNSNDWLRADNTGKVYGRHGDIKPENILWFRTHDNDDTGIGVLKISDFGLVRFHSWMTRTDMNAKTIPVTGTYRAPEYDTKNKVSQEYDIWGIGCLFLEFVTWYLLGFDAVQADFCQIRIEDDPGNDIAEDTFFRTVDLGDGVLGAEVKPGVIEWIQSLRENEKCTEYIQDMLDCIQAELLVPDRSLRSPCGAVVSKLSGMLQRCEKEEKYRLEPAPKPRQVTRTDSDELKTVQLELSPDMRQRYKPSSDSHSVAGTATDNGSMADLHGPPSVMSEGRQASRRRGNRSSSSLRSRHTSMPPPSQRLDSERRYSMGIPFSTAAPPAGHGDELSNAWRGSSSTTSLRQDEETVNPEKTNLPHGLQELIIPKTGAGPSAAASTPPRPSRSKTRPGSPRSKTVTFSDTNGSLSSATTSVIDQGQQTADATSHHEPPVASGGNHSLPNITDSEEGKTIVPLTSTAVVHTQAGKQEKCRRRGFCCFSAQSDSE